MRGTGGVIHARKGTRFPSPRIIIRIERASNNNMFNNVTMILAHRARASGTANVYSRAAESEKRSSFSHCVKLNWIFLSLRLRAACVIVIFRRLTRPAPPDADEALSKSVLVCRRRESRFISMWMRDPRFVRIAAARSRCTFGGPAPSLLARFSLAHR